MFIVSILRALWLFMVGQVGLRMGKDMKQGNVIVGSPENKVSISYKGPHQQVACQDS